MQKLGARFGFLLAAVSVSLRWTLVSPHPLGLEAKEIGINQRLPNYLPSYNGIFSIHALNFSSSTADTPAHAHQFLTNVSSLTESEHEGEEQQNDQETKLYPEDGTAANEVDYSEDRQKLPDLTTFPQLHVVTHTIGGDVTSEDDDAAATTDDEKPNEEEEESTVEDETTTELTPTDSESLHEGAEDIDEDAIQRPESNDLFDHLLKTIQGHWLEFVGKMKMSVLDVWKSISTHMMERLETFATNV